MQPDLDVLTIGRSSVDLYPLQVGRALEDVTSFGKFVGGSPTNVAVAASRLGLRAGVLTGVGDDPFGRFIARELEAFGVDASGVVALPDAATSLAFCEIYPPDDFPLYFRRDTPSPELRLGPDALDARAVTSAGVLWLSVTGLSLEPSRSMHHAALALRELPDGAASPRSSAADGAASSGTSLADVVAGSPGLSVLDLDYRPMFWVSPGDARAQVQAVLPRVSVAVGNLDECEIAVGERDPHRAADALLAAGVRLAIVKQGPTGVLAATRYERIEVPATPCHVLNGLGAGDAFGGALCRGLLAGDSLTETIEAASAAGAIVASRLECSGAMPTPAEIALVRGLGRVPADLGAR